MGKQRKNGEEKGKKQEGSFTLSLLAMLLLRVKKANQLYTPYTFKQKF